MSQENIEVVRRINEAFNRQDLAAMLDLLDPDAEWWTRADDPDEDVHRGHDAVAKYLADIYDAAEWRVELEECIDAADFVAVTVRLVGRGRASGASFDERSVQSYRVRDGRITELREYREMSEALQAVGLPE